MCGIAGVLSGNSGSAVEAMCRALEHRGPDATGAESFQTSFGSLSLGHTRLKIIDLSDSANQPMFSSDKKVCLIYNGEIYNFKELRKDLEKEGTVFKTQSDTEVLLTGYCAKGTDFFGKLNGIFAFALFDKRSEELILARDPLGVKPLYFKQQGADFYFASEIKALIACPGLKTEINTDAIAPYLSWLSIPEPLSILKEVQVLAPGYFAVLSAKGFHQKQYANPWEVNRPPASADEIDDILKKLIVRQSVSDAPLGMFLSGGIDSSLLACLLAEARGAKNVQAFTVQFEEAEYDESLLAEKTAQRLGISHQNLKISAQEVFRNLDKAIQALDQPSADGINTYFISGAVRNAGLKVALSGLGGDELFAGYSTFKTLPKLWKLKKQLSWTPGFLRGFLAKLLKAPSPSGQAKLKYLLKSLPGKFGMYEGSRSAFLPPEITKLLGDGIGFNGASAIQKNAESLLAGIENLDTLSQVSVLEMSYYMRNTLLRDADCMSMAHGLELRVPLLDCELVQAALSMPDHLKQDKDLPKPLLLSGIKDKIPKEIYTRKKTGFTFPFDKWMRKELKERIEDTFASSAFKERGWLKPLAVQKTWQRFLNGDKSVLWSHIWGLFVLEDWTEKHL